MNKFFRIAALWLGGALTSFATSVGFSDTSTELRSRVGTPWTDAVVEFGTFQDGFVPTALNRDQWSAHWLTMEPGYYAAANGTYDSSAELILADNASIAAGQQLYLWVTSGSEAGLFSDPSWIAPAVTALGLAETLGYTPQTSAIFGTFNGATLVATTASTDLSILSQPVSQSVAAGGAVTFSVVADGTAPFTYQWRKDGADLAGATEANLTIANVSSAEAGAYQVIVSNALGSIASAEAMLELATAPVIIADPPSQTPAPGESVTLVATATGAAPFSYQWFKNGVAIVGATSDTFVIPSVGPTDVGGYTVRISNSLGTVYSAAALVTLNYGPFLSNLSVRAGMVEGQTLIVGFVVAGGAKPILVRAAGPALNNYGLVGVSDPHLILYNDSTVVGSNEDWPASLAPTFASLGAFPFEIDSKDAALLQTISGPHTAHASGLGDGTVLVEAYDAGSSNGVKLSNLSARYHVGTGNDILIAGFVLGGTGNQQLLIRAVGPTLASYNVSGTLGNPQFGVYSDGTLVASNDDWPATLTPVFQSVGAFDLLPGSQDAALVVTLEAGKPYTVQVSGVNGDTGEALVEIYTVP